MSETKHTEGPWLAVDGILEPDDEGNARSFVRPVHSEGWQVAQTCGPNGSANARLIAASPDMLEALKAVVVDYDECVRIGMIDMVVEDYAISLVRAAIAKAEGSQP